MPGISAWGTVCTLNMGFTRRTLAETGILTYSHRRNGAHLDSGAGRRMRYACATRFSPSASYSAVASHPVSSRGEQIIY